MWPIDTLPEVKSFIGVIFAVTGNIMISVALNLQKYAHNELEQIQQSKYEQVPVGHLPSRTNRSTETYEGFLDLEIDDDYLYLHSKAWWLGIVLMIVGELGNFIAYAFAPASLIAPLGTVALISNVILAPIMLKETFRKQDLVGIVIATVGAIVVVINSKSNEFKLTPGAIWFAIKQPRFLIYLAVTIVLMACLISLSDRIGPRSILIDLSLVALFGGYTVLATKGFSSLLTTKFLNIFYNVITYVLIFVLVITAVLQIKYLNKALQRFDSTQVIPTQFVLFTISAIIGSAILYNDFEEMSFWNCVYFLSGCSLTFLGVYFITSNRKRVGRNRLAPLPSAGSGILIDSFQHGMNIYDIPDEGQRTTATRRIPRRHSLYTQGANSTTSLLHHDQSRHGSSSFIRLTAGALGSVGTRHSHALGLDQVFENYMLKMAEEQNGITSNSNIHRRSQSVPPNILPLGSGSPGYQNGGTLHSSPVSNSVHPNIFDRSRRYHDGDDEGDDDDNDTAEDSHPKSVTNDSVLSTSYTDSSYYGGASGYTTDSANTEDEVRTVSGLTTSSANSSRHERYSSDGDAFPGLETSDLPDLPYSRDAGITTESESEFR